MVTLRYLGTKCSYKEISDLFGYSEIFQCVQMTLNIICAEADIYIKWPTPDEATAIEK